MLHRARTYFCNIVTVTLDILYDWEISGIPDMISRLAIFQGIPTHQIETVA
jgi:hypothetical protein